MSPPATSLAWTLPTDRSRLEALLREHKLDRTLTTATPAREPADTHMPWHIEALDVALDGGLTRGELSEVVGVVSSGRTSLVWGWLAAATRRSEHVAIIDTFDRFDAASGAASGMDLTRVLWVRGQALSKTAGAVDPVWLPGVRAVTGPGTMLERTIDRALKALNLVLQSGVCTAVALDLADVPAASLRRIPHSTWLRVQRVIEGTDTACVLMASEPLARSAGGITILTGTSSAADGTRTTDAPARGGRWAGTHDRARRFTGFRVSARLVSPRRSNAGHLAVDSHMTPTL
jgi:recA bacterial DNA recombination protein